MAIAVEFLETYYKLVIPSALDGQLTYQYQDSPESRLFMMQWSAQYCPEPTSDQTHQYNQGLWIHAIDRSQTFLERAIALLCLRCCVSRYLQENVRYIVKKYGKIRPADISLSTVAAKLLSDAEPQPIVCLDQGQMYSVPDHSPLCHRGGDRHYPLAFEILRTWQPTLPQAKNLRSWVRQKSTNNNILQWFGICTSTPWYLLSRAKKWQLNRLSPISARKVNIFKSIYLGQLAQQRQNKYQRFPQPTTAQLQQLQGNFQTAGLATDQTSDELLQDLTQIAETLRDMDKKLTMHRADLAQHTEPDLDPDLERQTCDIIEQTFGSFSHVIHKATRHILTMYAEKLASGRQGQKKVANFHHQGYLLYCQGLSQQDIAQTLAINQSTVSRLLNIKNCLKDTEIVCIDLAQTVIMTDPYLDIDPDVALSLTDYLARLFAEDLHQAKRETSRTTNQGDRWQSDYSRAAQNYFQTHHQTQIIK